MRKTKLFITMLLTLLVSSFSASIASASPNYQFGQTEFQNFVWVNGGAYFQNPTGMDAEHITAGEIAYEAYDTSGNLVLSVSFSGGGWHAVSFDGSDPSNTLPDGFYKFKLVNKGGGTAKIKWGTIFLV